MKRRTSLHLGIVIVSIATLAFELALTRLFALVEWYHFAFLSISLAMLGSAASGTLLSILAADRAATLYRWACALLPASILITQLAVNLIPFDSYRISAEPAQLLYLAAEYAILLLPFGLSGLIVAYNLAQSPANRHRLYGANMIGSGLGSAGILLAIPHLGAEGTILACALLAAIGAILVLRAHCSVVVHPLSALPALFAALSLLFLIVRPDWFVANVSSYKSLSYALGARDAQPIHQEWTLEARIDVVKSSQIHSVPGLSLNYSERLPEQLGLTKNGDNLTALTQSALDNQALYQHVPSAVIYAIRPANFVLIINSGGGMDVAAALIHDADRVIAIEENETVANLLETQLDAYLGHLYRDSRVELLSESPRSVLERGSMEVDVIQFSLAESFHPLTAGAYSLQEDYVYTIEALADALEAVDERGMVVLTRWLQDTPTESAKSALMTLSALRQASGERPAQQVMAFRTWSTITLLISPTPFDQADHATLEKACDSLGYDLVYYAGMSLEKANRYNQFPTPVYAELFQQIFDQDNPNELIGQYAYDIRPPSDDRPYFHHYFRWRQIPAIWQQIGKVWQPFAGSGFLMVLFLLLIASLLSFALVLLPLRKKGRNLGDRQKRWGIVLYFGAIGFAYLFLEMPLMQQFILYLGNAARATAVVFGCLLLFSGIGNLFVKRRTIHWALPLLAVASALYSPLLEKLFEASLGAPLPLRAATAILVLAPLAMLMGVPFAGGLAMVQDQHGDPSSWAWAINGCASVIAAIAATIVAISNGFRVVTLTAGLAYLLAYGSYRWLLKPS